MELVLRCFSIRFSILVATTLIVLALYHATTIPRTAGFILIGWLK